MKRYLVSLAVFLVSMYSYSQILDWGNRLGGDYSDICCDIETDKHENIYITGGICNTVNFDLKGGSYILSANEVNQSEIFVALYNSERDLIKAFVLNGSAWDYATDLEIDSLRNIYISGFYSGTIDFDPGQDEYNMSSSKSMCFVAKYDSSGNFKWSKNISIMKETYRLIYSPLLFVDGNSNIYLSTPDTLCKIETDGNILWSVATNGSAVFDGRSSFYVSSIAYLSYYPVAQTDDTIFISKIDTSGFEVFTKEIILNSSERIVGFHTFDKSGNLLICGKFWGDCTFLGKDHSIVLINNRMECCASGCSATCPSAVAYIAKFDTTGNIIWAYDFKTDSPYPNNIETTVDGTIFMEGILNFSADFDHSENVAALTNSGHSHYIAKYDSSCNFISASQFMGSSYNERVVNFKLYKDSIALMCGYFRGTMDLDLTNDYLPLSSNSSEDIFLAKYSHFDIHDYTYNSIKLEKQTDVIRIFPNPARLSFQIKNPSKYDIENISIYNIEGQIVRSIEYQYSRDLIDISQLNNGIYFIRLKLDNKILSYKLVKLD